MRTWDERLEALSRRLAPFVVASERAEEHLHPFDTRGIHPLLHGKTRRLFDDGHFAEATFEAFKTVEKQVRDYSRITETGQKLMLRAFDKENPLLRLTPGLTISERDEQEGFRFLFAGSVMAIRNPRGHESDQSDSPDECLDHLALASMLLRRLAKAGYAADGSPRAPG